MRYRIAMFVFWSAGTFALGACSAGASTADTTPDPAAGTMAFELQLGPGVVLDEVDWAIDQFRLIGVPRPPVRVPVTRGSVDVSHSQSLQFVVGGLLAAPNYEIMLSATSDAGLICVSPLSRFSVTAGQVTALAINLTCTPPPPQLPVNTGSLAVDASVTLAEAGPPCPAVTGLSASPSGVDVGGSIALVAAGEGSAPTGVAFSWTISGGTGTGSFSDPTSASTSFTCVSPGTVDLTVAASDVTSARCLSAAGSATVTVMCAPSDGDGGDAG